MNGMGKGIAGHSLAVYKQLSSNHGVTYFLWLTIHSSFFISSSGPQ